MNIDIQELVRNLRQEGHFLRKRITKRNILKALREKRAIYKYDAKTGMVYAFCMLWPTKDPDMFESGTFWVAPSFRGNGHGEEVFLKCLALLPKGAGVFLITREIGVLELARNHGWQLEKSSWTKSEFWRRRAEPWDRVRPGVHSNGILMFLMP